jgi:hypothetical protein
VVSEEGLDAGDDRRGVATAHPHGGAQLARHRLALAVAELVEPLQEAVRQAVRGRVVVRGADHVRVGRHDRVAEAPQVVGHLAHVVLHAPQARDARADAEAREREELRVALTAREHLLHKLRRRAVTAGTSRNAEYLHWTLS